jgi:hypothetical protein
MNGQYLTSLALVSFAHSAPPRRDAHVCGHTLEFLAASVVVTRLSSVTAQMERSDNCMLIADTSFLQKTKAHTRSPCAVFMAHVQLMCVSCVPQGVAETSACSLKETCGKLHNKGIHIEGSARACNRSRSIQKCLGIAERTGLMYRHGGEDNIKMEIKIITVNIQSPAFVLYHMARCIKRFSRCSVCNSCRGNVSTQPKRPSSEPHGTTRQQQAIAKTPAK